MSENREPPPQKFVAEFDPKVQLTHAVASRHGIRFELLMLPPAHKDKYGFIDELLDKVNREMRQGTAAESPISVHVEHDRYRIDVDYLPVGKRDLRQDREDLLRIFGEMDVPITDKVREGMQAAFDAFDALHAQGHAATEAAKRGARKASRERRTR